MTATTTTTGNNNCRNQTGGIMGKRDQKTGPKFTQNANEKTKKAEKQNSKADKLNAMRDENLIKC